MYRVLLVDDERIFLDYLFQAVDWSQYQCEICACLENGREALDYIVQNRPDIAFMDISMPLLDGMQVCEEVARRNIPCEFVITTAYDEFQFAYKAIKLGIADYLLKPFTDEELGAALAKAIRRSNDRAAKREQSAERGKRAASERQKPAPFEAKAPLSGRIEAYIREHYIEPGLTVNQIARDLHFESSYLRRIYKRSTGTTISQSIEATRIQRAKELLASSDLRISEIAKKCGFSDHFYFSKRFKQLCGSTPSEYRSARADGPEAQT